MHRSIRIGIVSLLAVGVLGACGGDDQFREGEAPLGAGEPDLVITARDIAWHPLTATAPVGRPVRIKYVNDEPVLHNLHILAEGKEWKTELRNGPDEDILEVTFEEPGTYTYVCDVHPNMKGEIEAT